MFWLEIGIFLPILAAKTAINTVSDFLEKYPDSFDNVIFVLFDEKTKRAYDAELQINR